jgi:hypothetical protein
MATDNLAKLQRTSGYVSTVTLIVMIFVTILMIVSAILLIVCVFNAELLHEIAEAAEIMEGDVKIMLGLIILSLVFVDAIMYIAYKMFNDIKKSYTPFKKENSKRLMQISYLLIIYSIVLPIISAVVGGCVDLNNEMTIDFNPVFIAVAVIFYCMSLVFGYGTKLQQESDETL